MLLGAVSPDLIRDTSKSLAGEIAFFELLPFSYKEINSYYDFRSHWLRGGFPESLLALSDKLSSLWRKNFIQTSLERDLPLLRLSADPQLISKHWRMCAHLSGQLLNMQSLSNPLGLHATTVKRYLDFLEAAYLIQRLPPFHANLKKRLVKSPKLYLRDTGSLHQLLSIGTFEDLSGHPILGASWETYVIEQIKAILPD